MNKWNLAIAAYALPGILAFGHSAANYKCFGAPDLCEGQTVVTGFVSALANPLYWSWVVMERVK